MPDHERHSADHHGGHGGGADGAPAPAVGKTTQVDATAAKGHSVDYYKTKTKQVVGDIFSLKAQAIDDVGDKLAEKTTAGSSFLGKALEFLLPLGAGRLVADLKIDEVFKNLFNEGVKAFAKGVSGALKHESSEIDPRKFTALYAFQLRRNDHVASAKLVGGIHSVADGEQVLGALNSKANNQSGQIYDEAQHEALDAWTNAMQAQGTKKNGKNQGYSDPSTGQLALNKLLLIIDEKGHAKNPYADPDSNTEVRMEKVSNSAAKLDASRTLGSIPVVRTADVNWRGFGGQGSFGLGIGISGHIRHDELGSMDKWALASWFNHKKLDADNAGILEGHNDQDVINRDWTKGRDKVWNTIKGQTPPDLGFHIKGD